MINFGKRANRTERIAFRVEKQLKELLTANSEKAGMKLSDYIRELILKGVKNEV